MKKYCSKEISIFKWAGLTGLAVAMCSAAETPTSPRVMNPADLVESGYAQTPIVVTQSVTLEIDGALRTIDVTTPVWVTRGALAIPRERIPELQLLMQDIVRHAADCERLAAKSDDLRLRWIGLMGDAARWE